MKKVLPFLLILALLISVYVIKTQKDYKDEILNSFLSMEISFNKSNENLNLLSKYRLGFMRDKAKTRPDEVTPFCKRAEKAKKVSDEFVDFIESIKNEIKEELDNSYGRGDNYFFNTFDNKAKEITMKLDSTRRKLLDLLKDGEGVRWNPRDSSKLANQPYLLTSYDSGRCSSWEEMYLKHSTIVETRTLLCKLQNDCRNLEAEIIVDLARSIDYTDCGFDRLEAKVIPNTLMVKVGTEYRAEVILVASNALSNNPVIVNGQALPMKEGKGIYSVTPTSPGTYYWQGAIQVKSPAGIKEYPFKEKFKAF